uniref:TIGR03087 family PEP-CTERM/XrtA system glycosyltransferase n=1 Tax=Thaumasiovibrio occultus TaxID=1891184 RepID=UPI000B350F58|nr:TIGR03087 family PEP-CTERM/XrtA system glycosyltransferase [Thaumasiovibrio occultus]
MKPALLYLCHRLPYPPNKGDKIASYHILRFLSERYRIYLGCFIDDPNDRQYIEVIEDLCESCCIIDHSHWHNKLRYFKGLLTGEPLSCAFFQNRQLQQWVNSTIKTHEVSKAFVFSSAMASYLKKPPLPVHRVMHFVDVDSEKWRQYAESQKGLYRPIYQREFRTLRRMELAVSRQFEFSCFVTPNEVELFRSIVPSGIGNSVRLLENGIDTDYFDPSHASIESVETPPLYLVFTGAMDYWANVNAVTRFADVVWPKVREACPTAQWLIVGSSPNDEVLALNSVPGITVTGRVKDVRPYVLNARAAIAPMQIARGVQNKVLEAMAMARPVVTTAAGYEGIAPIPSPALNITDDVNAMADACIHWLSQPAAQANELRQHLIQHYSWESKLSPLEEYLDAS